MWWKILIPVTAAIGVATTAIVWFVFLSGKTNQDVFNRYRGPFSARRKQLLDIAAKLPPRGSVTVNRCRPNLQPAPVYDPAGKRFNTSVLMFEHLQNPDLRLQTPEQVDLGLFEGKLLMHLLWTGDRSPMAEHVRDQRAGPELESELKATLNQPYLVVARVVQYERPVIVDERTFVGGKVDLEAFLVDLRATEIVGEVRVRAKAEHFVETVKGRDAAFVYSSMMGKLRPELGKALGEVSRGTFVFEHGGGR